MKKMILLGALAVSCLAFADRVSLKSGTVLTGTLIGAEGDAIKFKSDDFGEVSIPKANIVDCLDVAAHPVVVATIAPVPKPPETWHGSLNVSASATRGNTVGESVSIVGDVSRRWEDDRLTASGGYYFDQTGQSKESKQKTTSRFELQSQEDHFWSKAFYSYVNGKYEFDRIMDLDYRYRLGLGLGYQWLEKYDTGYGDLSFNQELGFSYVAEKYEDVSKDDYVSVRYAHHLAWTIAPVDGLSFTHNFEFMPDTEDWSDNYLIDSDAGFAYAFRANWQLLARAEWDYQKQVAEGVKHSDIRYILGLGYKW